MFRSILNDVREQFQMGNQVTRLILINLFLFLAVNLIRVFTNFGGLSSGPTFYDTVISWLSLHSDMAFNGLHPWVFFTHMFLHVGFWHFLWNMLFLYWFGRIVGDLLGDRRIWTLYLLGGLAGALGYLLSSVILDQPGYALGASGAVMAIVVSAGAIAPDYEIRLLILGTVRLKYIVAVLILLDILGLGSMDNTGGHFAHLGGAAFGWYFVFCLRRGLDFSIYVNKAFDWINNLVYSTPMPRSIPSRKVMAKSSTESLWNRQGATPQRKDALQDEVDAILEKIHTHGFESLTDEEKEILYKASKQ